jgi:hypothetical protein
MPTLSATRRALEARGRLDAGRWPAAWLSSARAHPNRLAGGIFTLALALRLALAALGWPATDSDEGTMGLIARHIAYQGAHPIFFYGSNYMGPLDAYLAAGFFHLFGPSLFALRVATILISALALGAIYLLARRLCGQGVALATLALLAIGSQEALSQQTFARGGYAETLLFGALVPLLAVELALPSPSLSPTRGEEPEHPLPPWGRGQGERSHGRRRWRAQVGDDQVELFVVDVAGDGRRHEALPQATHARRGLPDGGDAERAERVVHQRGDGEGGDQAGLWAGLHQHAAWLWLADRHV